MRAKMREYWYHNKDNRDNNKDKGSNKGMFDKVEELKNHNLNMGKVSI